MLMRRPARPLRPGSTVTDRRITTVSGGTVTVPDPGRLVHLQFRRFAGCPVCHLHLRSVVRRHAEIEAAGVREVVVFHSSAEELLRHTADLPFAVVADPAKRLYAEFGVESAPRALLSPRAWGPVVAAVLRGGWEVLRGRERPPAPHQPGGRLGLPADFLIGSDGRILAAKYGEHVYDQWPVDELLRLASSHRSATGRLPAG
ncbi:peroxiredoxin-like family protein [Streptomyces sp. NEAU-H22]|uniref:peroxiredoxin-like family protein n=1 Tax=Streptomyces sp. NEAU-H22 TaxID=2994655 RepID=UPI002255DB60|nr:peroxiredoxin-like family protein [Streptomyces sp. NEAU-H22]MCX3291445.1 peroxiredoxin-like family protein [Streptomyces sp. NEAU-H22]